MRATKKTLAVAAIAVACALFSATAPAAAATPGTWSTPVSVSVAGQIAENQQIVTDGTTITTTWQQYDGADYRVHASSSTDGGATWSTPSIVSEAGEDAYNPQVATDGTRITLTWQRYDVSLITRIQTSSSIDGGVNWSPPVTVSDTGGGEYRPQVVTDGTTITIAWRGYDGMYDVIQTSSSINGGTTWSLPVNLSDTGEDADDPQVVTDGTTITTTWQRSDGSNDRIQASSSINGGTTWSTPVTLSGVGQDALDPQVATDGTTITTTWNIYDGSNDRIQASSSINDGTTWSTPVTLSGGDAYEPQVVTDGTTITITWSRYDGTTEGIQAASSADGGITWSTPVDLSDASWNATEPQVATDGTTITITWQLDEGSIDRIQASSSIAATPAPAPQAELANTGGASNFGAGVLAGGLLLGGLVVLGLSARHRQISTRN